MSTQSQTTHLTSKDASSEGDLSNHGHVQHMEHSAVEVTADAGFLSTAAAVPTWIYAVAALIVVGLIMFLLWWKEWITLPKSTSSNSSSKTDNTKAAQTSDASQPAAGTSKS